jgi:glycosyltransferase involved in cell wall biosynthesis
MKYTNILHIAPAFQSMGGGIFEVVENLSSVQSSKQENLVDILSLDNFFEGVRGNKKIYNFLPSKFSHIKQTLKTLIFLLRNMKQYDAVHIHGAWSPQFLLILPFIFKNKSKIVYQPHGLLCPERNKKNWFFKKIA